MSLNPPPYVYTPRGVFNFTAALNAQTTADYQFTAPLIIGGERLYVTNANIGDTVDIYIVDKNNVLGLGGTPQNPTIVAHLARGVFVIPATLMVSDNQALQNPITVGLFLRMIYTSTNTGVLQTQPQVVMNLRAYEAGTSFVTDSG